MSFSLITLNVRGLRLNVKRKALFLFAKQQKSDFCFFFKKFIQLLMMLVFGKHNGVMIFGLLMGLSTRQE